MGCCRRCRTPFLTFILSAALAGGCTHRNRPLEGDGLNRSRATLMVPIASLAADQRDVVDRDAPATTQVVDADGVFFGLAISGGGSRSANFSAAVMFHLERFGLLQDVDYISSVSGGSLTAAYYCLATDKQWTAPNVQHRLTHAFASDMIWRMIMPWNFLALTFSDWDRSDLLADTLRKNLFTRKGKELTFADLRPDRPRLLINATDLQTGKPFVFTNESFDRIDSDLSSYPIANAVAASAAVPVLLHHVTLRDYGTSFKQYRHLIDGGVNDNLGIRTLTDMYDAQVRAAKANNRPTPYPRGAVFAVIDAKTVFDAKLSNKADIGLFQSLSTGAGLTSTVLINRASSATLADIIVEHSPEDVTAGTLRKQKLELETNGYLSLKDRDGRPVDVVHLALSRVNDVEDLPFASFSQEVNSVATYFNISDTEAYHLYQAAELIVTRKFDGPLRAIGRRMAEAQAGASPPATLPAP